LTAVISGLKQLQVLGTIGKRRHFRGRKKKAPADQEAGQQKGPKVVKKSLTRVGGQKLSVPRLNREKKKSAGRTNTKTDVAGGVCPQKG